jgi:hypothetical protein
MFGVRSYRHTPPAVCQCQDNSSCRHLVDLVKLTHSRVHCMIVCQHTDKTATNCWPNNLHASMKLHHVLPSSQAGSSRQVRHPARVSEEEHIVPQESRAAEGGLGGMCSCMAFLKTVRGLGALRVLPVRRDLLTDAPWPLTQVLHFSPCQALYTDSLS